VKTNRIKNMHQQEKRKGATSNGRQSAGVSNDPLPRKFTWYFDPHIFWKEIFSGTQVS